MQLKEFKDMGIINKDREENISNAHGYSKSREKEILEPDLLHVMTAKSQALLLMKVLLGLLMMSVSGLCSLSS